MSPSIRLPFALALGFVAVWLFTWPPGGIPPAGIKAGAAIIALLGLMVAAAPHRKVVMRFGHLTWTREELCRHVLITGDTGCGKTSSGFNNILVQLTSSIPDWGGLAVGVKGDEAEFLDELLGHHGRAQQLVVLRVRPSHAPSSWQPPHRYNLLSDRSLPWTAHAKAVVDTASSLTEGRQDSFFKPMAQISLAGAFQLLDDIGQPVTLTRAYHLLTVERILSEALEELRELPASPERLRLCDFFDSTFLAAKAHEQREGIEGTIKTYLAFFLDPDLAAVFSSDEPNTVEIAHVDDGAIITTGLPQRFVTERRYVNTYLKILFYYHALRRYELSKADQAIRNQLLFVADEYQELVTASEDGMSDHTTIDRIRGAKCAIIAGMQSEVSADPAIGRDKRKVLSLNFRSRFIFRAADPEGATASAEFIGKRTVWMRSRSSKAWSSVTHSRREDEDFVLRPSGLAGLKDHHAVIVHPSKRHVRRLLVPVGGDGKRKTWFRS